MELRTEHFRVVSQSTAASSSPESDAQQPCATRKTLQKPKYARSCKTIGVKSNIKQCKRRGDDRGKFGSGKNTKADSRAVTLLSRTPALSRTAGPLKAEYIRSPGGTDYIVTPGRNRICMTDFLASFDLLAAQRDCPGIRAIAHYSESMLREWLAAEKTIADDVYLLSFSPSSEMECFRQMALHSVFAYAAEYKLHEKTVHLCCLNINRLIHARFVAGTETKLSQDLFGTFVVAALRHAIKSDESYEKADRFRLDPRHVWRLSGFLAKICRDQSVEHLNQVEVECLKILETPANPPLAPEFLDRYLAVGAWPEYQSLYKELGSYLLALALFAHDTVDASLRRTTNSRLAAAALILAVKVINTDRHKTSYEFWPDRLACYTNYSLESLKPVIKGLSYVLTKQTRPRASLSKYYPKWSSYDWN